MTIDLKGLEAQASYRFRIFSENGVSKVAREPPKSAEITVNTEHSGTYFNQLYCVLFTGTVYCVLYTVYCVLCALYVLRCTLCFLLCI